MLAQAFTFDPAALKTTLLVFFLVTSVAIGGAIISRYRKSITEPEDTPDNLLATLKDAYQEGELDATEFKRIQDVLAGKPNPDVSGKPKPEVFLPPPSDIPNG